MKRQLPWWCAQIIFLPLLFAAPARATQCQAIAGGSSALAAIDAEIRIRYLDGRLNREAKYARIYSGVWGGIYGALTIGQLSLYPGANSNSERAMYVAGSAASFIGLLGIAALPLSVEFDQIKWRKELQRGAPGGNQCALLADAERFLLRGAESEEFGTGPLVHVANFVVNIAAGLVVGLKYDGWSEAAALIFPGIAIGEVQIITQPTGMIEDLRRYRAGDLGSRETKWLGHWAVAPNVTRDHAGLMFAASF